MSSFVMRGRSDNPVPLNIDDEVVRISTCPSCEGRGWFLINPFATGGQDGAGGLSNKCQCLTCVDAYAYFMEHRRLPEGIPYPEVPGA
jgi:hypothetical protein